jgi:hypothetical protein
VCRSLALFSLSAQAKEKSAEQGEAKTFFSLSLSFSLSGAHGLIFHRKFLIGPFSTEFAHRGACRIKKKVICSTSKRHISPNANCARPLAYLFLCLSKRKRAQLEPLWLKIMAAFLITLYTSLLGTQGNFIFAASININIALNSQPIPIWTFLNNKRPENSLDYICFFLHILQKKYTKILYNFCC